MILELINGVTININNDEAYAELTNNSYEIKDADGHFMMEIPAILVLSDGTDEFKLFEFESRKVECRGFDRIEMARAVEKYGKLLSVSKLKEE